MKIMGGNLMKVKNVLIISVAMLVLISTLGMVSAGLFDFGSDEPAMVNKEFDGFSMDIPSDLELNESDSLNGGRVLENAVYDNGGTISFDELYSNPKYVHKSWDDENSTVSVILIDFKEDGYKNTEDAVKENFVNATLLDKNDDFKIYNTTDGSKGSFTAAKEKGDKSVVIVSGDDRDLITDMISSLKFD
jgi:hypothetical protein